MTTFGTVICSPSARFSTPRSYIEAISVPTQGQPFTWDGHNLRIAVAIPIVYWMNIHFNPHFMDWSSNVYTLDHVVDEIYYDVNGGPTHQPFTATMYWGYFPPYHAPSLLFYLGVLLGPNTEFVLESAPAGYWMPKFLP